MSIIFPVVCCVFLGMAFCEVSASNILPDSGKAPYAKAQDVKFSEAYHPADRPGYACWTVLWTDMQGSAYLAFVEKRRGQNKLWQPVPLDFWESMSLPVNYHNAFCNGDGNVITESVVLRTTDGGEIWTETGRSPIKYMNLFSWASLPDGSIIRVVSDDYSAFDPSYEPQLRAEVSRDGGNTWQIQGLLMEGYHAYAYQLKRLRDGTLVQLAPYWDAFGPGRPRRTRRIIRPYVKQELTCGVFYSTDQGKTWSFPQTAFPGMGLFCNESTFVELPNGDLLFINSRDFGPKMQLRQKFRKTTRGFVPGPVMEVVKGIAPERIVLTRDGLLVGAWRRTGTPGSGVLTCSADEGATWHTIQQIERIHYQPYMIELPDGRLMCSWHIGGDNFFGQLDQWAGITTFRLKADLPKPTKLTINRKKNADGTKYLNKYIAELTYGSTPVPGEKVNFFWDQTGDQNLHETDPRESGRRVDVVTNQRGQAELDLSELDSCQDRYHGYRVAALFEPDEGESWLSGTESEIYSAYAQTMTKDELDK